MLQSSIKLLELEQFSPRFERHREKIESKKFHFFAESAFFYPTKKTFKIAFRFPDSKMTIFALCINKSVALAVHVHTSLLTFSRILHKMRRRHELIFQFRVRKNKLEKVCLPFGGNSIPTQVGTWKLQQDEGANFLLINRD